MSNDKIKRENKQKIYIYIYIYQHALTFQTRNLNYQTETIIHEKTVNAIANKSNME